MDDYAHGKGGQVKFLALLFVVLTLASCSESGKPLDNPAVSVTTPARVTDAGQLTRGAEVYRAHCAACHGSHAQGAPRWQQLGPDGKYPAPPLDGSAHAWHHPLASLKDTIRNGTQRLGGSMPPWRGKLTEAEIEAVIAYFHSLWPEEIYRAWADIDRRARLGVAK
jgi:mono/diheme cytochrome c family protein